jgi:hypothetical protein
MLSESPKYAQYEGDPPPCDWRDGPFIYPGAETTLIRKYLDLAQQGGPLPARAITDREEEIL